MSLEGALLAQLARLPCIPLGEDINLAKMVLQGTACYESVSLLLQGGLRAFVASWRLDQERVEDAEALLSHIAGPPAIVSGAELTAWGREPVDGGLQPVPLAVLLF